ncbi:hypothetical protein Leryth_005345 [Lithospermum erythrorhizon]|nr:hypothetical protein Leryth_005345 [Lithospermum erythrorhizon]
MLIWENKLLNFGGFQHKLKLWPRRPVLVKSTEGEGGEDIDITPKEFAVRTKVQDSESGGAFCISGDTIVFSNCADQRLYRQSTSSTDNVPVPMPITPDYGQALVCYADGVFDSRFNRYVTLREDLRGSGNDSITTIVSVDLHHNDIQEPKVLLRGNDFYAFPRLDSKGERIAWIEWSQPHMPWDKSKIWVGYISDNGDIQNRICVAGKDPDIVESPTEPKWSPQGELFSSLIGQEAFGIFINGSNLLMRCCQYTLWMPSFLGPYGTLVRAHMNLSRITIIKSCLLPVSGRMDDHILEL